MPKEKEGKKKKKNKQASKRWEKYSIDAESIKKPRYCPRCGPGIILAKHKNRFYCGKCHYVEFVK